MKVIAYSTKTCLWCKKAKEFLNKHNVEFTDKDVGDDTEAAEEMVKKSGQRGVPVIEIRRSHSVSIIAGFNEEKLKQMFGIK